MKKTLIALSFALAACASNHKRLPASEVHGTEASVVAGVEKKASERLDTTPQLAREMDAMQRWKTLHDNLVGRLGEKKVAIEMEKLVQHKKVSDKEYDGWNRLFGLYAKKLPRHKKEIASLRAAFNELQKFDSGANPIGETYRAHARKKIGKLDPKSPSQAQALLNSRIDHRIQEINKLPQLANMSQAQKLSLYYEQVEGAGWFTEELYSAGARSAHVDRADPTQQGVLKAMNEDNHRLMFAISDKLETGLRDFEKIRALVK